MKLFLLFSVFVVSVCGLVYELISATIASYLLGDSVTHFSTIIGTYLFAMGLGSYVAQYVKKDILDTFIKVELLVALIGGSSAALLYALFPYADNIYFPLYTIVLFVGFGVGLEIPLLMRILKDEMDFSKLISTVLSFDYVGALFASILFPMVFIPRLGIIKTSFFFGILNCIIGLAMLIACRQSVKHYFVNSASGLITLVLLSFGFFNSETLLQTFEESIYNEPVIYASSSPYQRVVLSRAGETVKLYLNGQLQFSSLDEYRYHEALVHPGLSSLAKRDNILILGGGDGLAVREILKYSDVKKITLIDLDPKVINLFKGNEMLRQLNMDALNSSKLEIVNQDAFTWLKTNKEKYDFIVIDLPDPTSFSLGKLYSNYFYAQVKAAMREDSLIVVQSTSPLIARKSFWMIEKTLRSVGFETRPYHVYVPSFTEWGFILASKSEIKEAQSLPNSLKYLNLDELKNMFAFPKDMMRIDTDIQTLSTQSLVSIYSSEWNAVMGQ